MSNVPHVLSTLADKGIVLVVDDEDRENEGDLIMAAEFATTDTVAFFLEHTSGFLCVAIDEERAAALDLPMMVPNNTDRHHTAFLVSVDYRHGTTTGIGAGDRAATIRALADGTVIPSDFTRPGHVMPLLARPGGVLERGGHTEAGVDLCTAAGLSGSALICEIVTPDRREMMRGTELAEFAAAHGIPIVSIAELRAWRRHTERRGGDAPEHRVAALQCTGASTVPTEIGVFLARAYRATTGLAEHMALVMGDPAATTAPLVRFHSECLTGDLAGSLRCDCGNQFRSALAAIADEGAGVLVYLRGHEGRGIGLGAKLRAYELQQREGLDTVDANVSLGLPIDARDYGDGCAILRDLGIDTVRLLTNNPDKVQAVERAGITVRARIAHEALPNMHSLDYLTTKRDRMGHLLDRIG